MRRRLARVGPLAFVVVAVAAALWAVHRNAAAVSATLSKLGILAVALSVLFGALAVYLTCQMWRCVLHGLGAPTPRGESSRVFFISQLGKYLPGSVWPVLAQMEYGRRVGVGRKNMLAANALTVALSLAVGLIVAACTLPLASADAIGRYWWAFACLPFLVALIHPKAVPGIINAVFRRLGRETMTSELGWPTMIRASGWALLSWLAFGLHLYVLVAGIGVDGWQVLAECVGGFALAASAGVIFLPAPAGAGVRDAVLIVALAPDLGSGSALTIGLVSRVLLIVVDLMLAAGFGLVRRRGVELAQPADGTLR